MTNDKPAMYSQYLHDLIISIFSGLCCVSLVKQQISKYMVGYRKGKLGIETLLPPMQFLYTYSYIQPLAVFGIKSMTVTLKPNDKQFKEKILKMGKPEASVIALVYPS